MLLIQSLETQGKPYNVFADHIEDSAVDQFVSAMQLPYVVRGALMPDCHTGYSLPIGAVVATDGMILPSWCGYDIGCGMCAVPTTFKKSDVVAKAEEIFKRIYLNVPVGFNHNKVDSVWNWEKNLPCTEMLSQLFMERKGLKQLGTLGGGNHFIEIGYDEKETVWIIVHSGSRNIGHSVATHYMKLASGDGKAREGHFGFRTDSEWGKEYIKDLTFCLAFALENRKQIVQRVAHTIMTTVSTGTPDYSGLINRNHNHAELKDGLWIHRKGATHAEEGMLGVIPGNMRDGSFIVRGLGNPDSLWSSSHGAGRCMGRKEAERKLTLDKFTEQMVGVTAKVDKETLDESPDAYKNIHKVMSQQSDLVEVLHHVKPIINIKG